MRIPVVLHQLLFDNGNPLINLHTSVEPDSLVLGELLELVLKLPFVANTSSFRLGEQ